MIRRRLVITAIFALSLLGTVPAGVYGAPRVAKVFAPNRFYLRDGDRVVFYGDSITDQRLYTTFIESYCLSQFPNRRFTFVHSGWGGDRVTGGGGGPMNVRLQRDVLPYKPTVVTICLGMNDGGYKPYDDNTFRTYARGYDHIIEVLRKQLPGVRITLLTASAYDDVTRAPGFPGGYNGTLIALSEYVHELGRRYNLVVADTNAPLVAALMAARSHDPDLAAKILPDRVHPGPGGHMVMAAAVLKAWNAPDTVAAYDLNALSGSVTAVNADVSDPRISTTGVSFRYTDHALPWPVDRDPAKQPASSLVFASTDIEQTLNRWILKVNGLTAPNYVLKVDGKQIATLRRVDLESGVDLAAIPEMPYNLQAVEVLALIREHNDLHFKRWRVVQFPHSKNNEPVSANVKKQMDDLDVQEAKTLANLRAAVRPKQHALELTAAP